MGVFAEARRSYPFNGRAVFICEIFNLFCLTCFLIPPFCVFRHGYGCHLLRWFRFIEKKEAEKIIRKNRGRVSANRKYKGAGTCVLEDELNTQDKNQNKVFVGMLYAKPFVAEAVDQIAEFRPDEIVLLPLYPQYSTTTAPALLLAQTEIKK